MIFSIVYFILYPSLGSYAGTLGWTQAGQYEAEVAAANEKYGPMYAAYAGREIPDLTQDPKALALGHSLFVHNCTTCHGSDGRGAVGFPNLTDDDWLYGGDPQTIEQTITNGRQGVMPALGSTLGEEGVEEVIAYVLSLSGRESDPGKLARGQTRFAVCAASCGRQRGREDPLVEAVGQRDALHWNTEAIGDGRHQVRIVRVAGELFGRQAAQRLQHRRRAAAGVLVHVQPEPGDRLGRLLVGVRHVRIQSSAAAP